MKKTTNFLLLMLLPLCIITANASDNTMLSLKSNAPSSILSAFEIQRLSDIDEAL